MLHATHNTDSVTAMLQFNKLILDSKKIRKFDNVKCAIYYHIILSHYIDKA